MNNNFKPGGGNKPQPYIPKGNGDKSGEYTSKSSSPFVAKSPPLPIINKKGCFNFYNSCLVKSVNNIWSYSKAKRIPLTFKANTVIKKVCGIYVISERYYNNYGEPYLDIDYSNHGNTKLHPFVPHIHVWIKQENGELFRERGEKFK